MKQCPKCYHLYEDDSLRFCLDDGTSLVSKVSLGRPQTTMRVNAPRTHNEKATEVLPSQLEQVLGSVTLDDMVIDDLPIEAWA